jgi:hypothetical protein
LPFQHRGPVLSLGTTCAGLDIKKAVERVGWIGEHAPKLHAFDQCAQGIGISLDGHQCLVVGLFLGHVEQFARILQARFEAP